MAGLVRKINHFNIGFVLLPTTFVPFRNKNWSRKIEIDLIVIIHSTDKAEKVWKFSWQVNIVYNITNALCEMLPI